jgi:P-type Mg2+ transporter
VIAATLLLPATPLAGLFGFQPLPVSFLAVLVAIVLAYVFAAEKAKSMFYRRERLS